MNPIPDSPPSLSGNEGLFFDPPSSSETGHLRLRVHAAVFVIVLSLWTWKLLVPHPVPEDLKHELDRAGLSFVAAKSLHAVGYAFLTMLAITMPVSVRWRRLLVGVLVLHGVGTEIGQLYIPNRTGRVNDVLIDWAGIAGGCLCVWWRSRVRRRYRLVREQSTFDQTA